MKKTVSFFKRNYKLCLSLFIVFCVALIHNGLSPYTTDDFTYMFSFADGERITSPLQIFSSMVTHYLTMNGRTVPHLLVQFMLLLPKWVFNILNAALYTGFVYLIYRVTSSKKEFSALVFFAIPVCLWVHTPVYGQVFLWLTGSANYYWAYFTGLIFMCFYITLYRTQKLHSRRAFIALCILGFVFGAYSENTSFPVIFVSFLLLVATMCDTKKVKYYSRYVIPVVFGAVGYLTMLLSPAQATKLGQTSFAPSTLFHNVIDLMVSYYTRHQFLLIVLTLLFVIGIYARIDKKELLIGLAYFVISLISVMMLCFASYLADRSLAVGAVFLVLAIIQLAQALRRSARFDILAYCLAAFFIVNSLLSLWDGSYDIYSVYCKNQAREAYIEQQIEAGETSATVPIIYPLTKYSCKYILTDLRTEENYDWPNGHMARYYGLERLYGIHQ